MTQTVAELMDYLCSIGLANPDTIAGCTPAEVEEVRQAQGVDRLPVQYEEFLLTAGRAAGELLMGTDFFYPRIVQFDAAETREFLAEHNLTEEVGPGSIILGMHQGYQLYWLEPGEPSGPVHFYSEGSPEQRRSWPTLVDCLRFEADHQKRVRERFLVYDKRTGEWRRRVNLADFIRRRAR